VSTPSVSVSNSLIIGFCATRLKLKILVNSIKNNFMISNYFAKIMLIWIKNEFPKLNES
jgi:hypothetical protein